MLDEEDEEKPLGFSQSTIRLERQSSNTKTIVAGPTNQRYPLNLQPTSGNTSRCEYDPVSNEEEEENDRVTMDNAPDERIPSVQLHQIFLCRTLLPDDRFHIYGLRIVDGPEVIKLLKFAVFTYFSIYASYKMVRWIDWEHDAHFTLDNFWTYESVDVAMDTFFFFFVGRLYKQRGVDHLAWVLTVVASNIYSSYITNLSFLQHSFTLYEMHCRWPWQLWAFLIGVIPFVLFIFALHVRKAYQDNLLVVKMVEMMTCFWFLLVPFMRSPYMHLHHWFNGFLLGMHFNFDVWWSRLCMAWCWGLYINGIAVYGRDPVLSCAYGLYISASQYCPYLSCYIDGINHPPPSTNDTHTPPVVEMVPVDWRNCSSGVGYTP